MRRFIRKFFKSDSGATTVDWVVITAMAMSLSLAAYGGIRNGTKGATENVSSAIAARPTTISW